MKVKGRVPPTLAQREMAVAMYKQEPPLSYEEMAQFLGLKIQTLAQVIFEARKADPTLPYRTAADRVRLSREALADPNNQPKRYRKPGRLGVLGHDEF